MACGPFKRLFKVFESEVYDLQGKK
jgi:hypothetical protein